MFFGTTVVKAVAWLVLPALVLVGCTTGTGGGPLATDPIVMSADTAALVGEQFVATNAIYVQLCAPPPRLKAERCNAWTKFAREFQAQYGAAHAAYKAALSAGDAAGAQGAARVVQALSNALLLYYVAREGS